MHDSYDVVLVNGCTSTPRLDDLVERVPALADPDVQTRMLGWRQHWPDFLGLDLPQSLALVVYARLKRAGAHGGVDLAAYRTPRVTVEQARTIAEPVMAEQQAQYPDMTFSPLQFSLPHGGVACWAFLAACKEWQEKGLIPGALFVSVDKLDGHVWTREEFARREIAYEQFLVDVKRLLADDAAHENA